MYAIYDTDGGVMMKPKEKSKSYENSINFSRPGERWIERWFFTMQFRLNENWLNWTFLGGKKEKCGSCKSQIGCTLRPFETFFAVSVEHCACYKFLFSQFAENLIKWQFGLNIIFFLCCKVVWKAIIDIFRLN